jgi:chalcone synthase
MAPVAAASNGVEFNDQLHRRTSTRAQQAAEGPATVLAIGTAVPPFVHEQSTYADYYFDVTNCNHKTELKAKFKRICDKMQIDKRHMVVRRELLEENPSIASYMDNSMNARHQVVMEWVPKLAKEAAENAIKEWGRSVSEITHIVMATTSVVNMPGVDLLVAKSLGLSPKVRRVMLYQTGCWGGAAALRVAKDLAENNKGARVLIVCSECTAIFFRGPSEEYLDGLVGQGLFGDGAAAVVVGSDPIPEVERPLFEIQWSGEMVVPDSETAIDGHLMEAGMYYHLRPEIPKLVSKSIEEFVGDARAQAENKECNELFWAVHPGGAAILNQIENQLALVPEKLAASREILRNYGNMASACVLFVLDQIRNKSIKAGASTTGEGKEFGLLIGIGPGLTMECCVLKSVALN